jgi:soluble lytic murein transglycosylase-like protein
MRRLVLITVLLLAAGSAQAQERVRAHVEVAAARFGLPVDLIETVIAVESGGQARAVSPAGAMGLMQLMPGTWADLRLRLELGADPFDPGDNILAGAAYLRELRDRYGAPGFLAAYNAGPGRYEASLTGRPLPQETRLYVERIVGRMDPLGRGHVDWRAIGLFPPTWSQGLGGPTTGAAAGPTGSASRGDGQGLFVVRRGQAR